MSRLAVAAALLVATSYAPSALAHIITTYPAARYSMDDIKDYPCGVPGNPPGANAPTVLQAGDTITILVDEFVDHDGHFRIAISNTGDEAFVNPTDYDDFYADPNVLLDDITDTPGVESHEIAFTVPDMDCNPCTMQILQIMYSGQSFSEGALYYNCSDIVIEGAAGSTGPGEGTGGADSSSGGGEESESSGSAGTSGATDASAGESEGGESSGGGGTAGTTGNVSATGPIDPSAGDDDDGGGCGCSSDSPRTGAWSLALVLLALRRRRG